MIYADPLILFSAMLVDFLIGDPRWLPHPVVAIGKLVHVLDVRLRREWLNERLAGTILLLLVVFITAGITMLLLRVLDNAMPLLGWFGSIYVSASCLAARSLHNESKCVITAVLAGDLPGARRQLSFIVGRDTAQLEEPEIMRAVMETVAENTSDGIIAPLFWLAIGGPVAAMAFKAVSTLDSMVGYRNPRYLRMGWASARMDDVLNFIPARISALLIVLAAPLTGCSTADAIRITLRDRHKHPSPNSGHPEAAAAGALGIQLGGLVSYNGIASCKEYIGDNRQPINEYTYNRMIKLMYLSTLMMSVFYVIVFLCLRGFCDSFI